jgi:putative mRNA 3-end processing factor
LNPLSRLLSKINIKNNGAILIGNNISCDGYDVNRSIGIVSHFHGDHIKEFENSITTYKSIYVTPETKEVLIAIKGDWLDYRKNLIDIPYLTHKQCDEDKIIFYPAQHCLGSAQAFIELEDFNVLYAGDISGGASSCETDILIVEAAYGAPNMIRTYTKEDTIRQFVSKVELELAAGPVCILANRGTLQEAMNVLHFSDVDVPFLFHKNIIRVSEVYRKYGIDVGDYLEIGKEEAEEIMRNRQPHLAFYPLGSHIYSPDQYVKISLSGWDTITPIITKIANKEYLIGLFNHCDFKELLDYVQQCNPKIVVVDSSRYGNADIFARNVKRKLGIKAYALP